MKRVKDRRMKRTTDHRTVALFLWVFGIVALGLLGLHRLTISRLEEQVKSIATATGHNPKYTEGLGALVKDVRSDLLSASLVTLIGLLLTVLGQRLLNLRLARRLERERLSTE